jgi:molybdopterin-guanine dinucleotide biosynthesis protein A
VCLKDKNNFVQPLPIVLHKSVLSFIELQIEKKDFKLQNLIHAYNQSNSTKIEYVNIRHSFKNLNSLKDLKL